MLYPIIFVSFVVLLAIFSSTSATDPSYTSNLPLSPTSNAFTRGSADSPVTVDLWIDLACSDCMNDWPVISSVVEKYGDSVKFNYRVFPLPYHQFAFLLAKTVQVVSNHCPPSEVFSFIDHSYLPSAQAQIYNSATSSLSYSSVLSTIVSPWVVNSTSLTSSQYESYMSTDYQNNSDADYNAEMNARYAFKNAAENGIIGTPTVWINGVEVDGLDDAEQWDMAIAEVLPGL